jgi:cytochrome P450 family 110
MQSPNSLKTPSALQKIQWVIDPVQYMKNASQQYPDLFTADITGFGDKLVFVQHPEAIQQILTNDASGSATSLKPFAALGEENKLLQPLIGDYSVIMLDREPHKRRRQLLAPPFHGGRMQAYGQIISQITRKIFDQLLLNQSFLARVVTQQISLEVMLQAVFGLTEGERYQQLKRKLAAMTNVFESPLAAGFLYFSFLQKDLGAWSPWGRFVRLRQEVDDILYSEIGERRKQHHDREDILSLLMSAHDEAGNSMTDQELRDELMTLLLAGHETTASAIAWGLYWIYQQPQVREKLRYELASLGDSPNPIDIVRLRYLTAVCNEVLRITPVAMLTFPRMVQKPVKLLDYSLEPGMMVVGCIYLLHRRTALYPEPDQFRPERFLERQFSPYEFMPFGGGARRCVGDALAPFEMKLVLATVLFHYELIRADSQPEWCRRRGITLAPAKGVKMRLMGYSPTSH